MLTSEPLVSIVVPSWEKGPFLRGTLESLLGQTYPHIEILVHDNLSTDETGSILTAYAPKLTRVVQARDQGQSDALQQGFAQARGEILGWLNADDLLMPDAIAQAVAAFRAAPAPDVVYGHCVLLSETGQFLRYFNEVQPFSADLLRNRINFIAQPSTFFTRSAYEHIGGIDVGLHYVMDWDLWCRFAEAGHRFQFVDAVLSATRQYHQTKTSGGGMARQSEILHLNRRYKTTRSPLAAAAHIYQDLIKPRLPFLHPLLRRLWRLRGGSPYMEPTIVRGVAFPDRVAEPLARIQIPVFAELTGAHLHLAHPHGESGSVIQAALNGQSGALQRDDGLTTATWHFEEPLYLDALDLAIRVEPLCDDLRVESLVLEGLTVPSPSAAVEE